MQLQTKLPSRRNTMISVNGTKYKIDAQGIIDVPDAAKADISKLLALGGEFSKKIEALAPVTLGQPKPGASLRTAKEFLSFLEGNDETAERVAGARSFKTIMAIGLQGGFKFTETEWREATQERAAAHPDFQKKVEAEVAPPKPAAPPAPVAERKVLEGTRLIVDPAAPAAPAKRKSTELAQVNGQQGSIDDVVDDPAEDEVDEAGDGGPPLVRAEQGAPVGGAAPAGAPPTADEELAKELAKLPAYALAGKIPAKIPEDTSGDWPTPLPQMSMSYLRRMAGAYKVKVPVGTSKESVIESIRKEMFEAPAT